MGSFNEYGTASKPLKLLLLHEDTNLVVSHTLRPTIPSLAIETGSSRRDVPGHVRNFVSTSRYHAMICSPTLSLADGISVLIWSPFDPSPVLESVQQALLLPHPLTRVCGPIMFFRANGNITKY